MVEAPLVLYVPADDVRQARSYVQARAGSCLLVPRRLDFFETQINVMRNCVIGELKSQNCYHQMSDFTAKMHQIIRFRLGREGTPAFGLHPLKLNPR